MLQLLPEIVNIPDQVKKSGLIEGNWPLSRLPRLEGLLVDTESSLEAKLQFAKNGEGIAYVAGEIRTELALTCQRCMEPVQKHVECQFKLAFLQSEKDAENLPDDMEAYIIDGSECSIIELIEEELLLSLPIVSKHESDCSDILNDQRQRRLKETKVKPNPFAVLKNIKFD